MKPKVIVILFAIIMIFLLMGCAINKSIKSEKVNSDYSGAAENNKNELNRINNKIINYFSVEDAPLKENMSFNYIDEEKNVVVVGLKNNSEENQQEFRKLVVDSPYIKFVQGENLAE